VSVAQLALFSFEKEPRPHEQSRGFARYPQTPGYKAHGASHEAARQIACSISRLRAEVLAELDRWPGGRTADEIANSLRRSPLSVRPRLSELKTMGKIVASGERRRGESGMSMSVWKVA
jgi:hypothetical protein